MKKQKISGKVLKKGRKWLKIVQTGKNEKYPDDLLINELTKDFIEGQEFADLLVETEFEQQYRGGYKITHTAITEEDERSKDIAKWWGYVKDNYENKGYIYKRGIEELQALNCHEYDEQIAEMQKDVAIKNAIFYLRDNFEKKNYISEKSIQVLHDYNIHEYDDEIAEMRRCIAAKKAGVDISEKEKLETITERADLEVRKKDGALIRSDEKVYEVQKSRFEKGEYAGTPWDVYIYFCKDVTETSAAKQFLEHEKALESKKAEVSDAAEKVSQKREQLFDAIEEHDILKNAECDMPNGEIIFDNFSIYGAGRRIVNDGEYIWNIVNNGSDGSFWDLNHIHTGSGAGAYGWKCEKSQVSELVEEYKSLKSNYDKLFAEYENML